MARRILGTLVTLTLAAVVAGYAYLSAGFACFMTHHDRLPQCLPYQRAWEAAAVASIVSVVPALLMIWARGRVRQWALVAFAVCVAATLFAAAMGAVGTYPSSE